MINDLYVTISADPRGFPGLFRCSRPLARMLWKPGQSWCLSRFLHGYGTAQGCFCVKFRVDSEQELSQRPRYVTALCQSAAAGIIRLSDCTFARSVGSTSSIAGRNPQRPVALSCLLTLRSNRTDTKAHSIDLLTHRRDDPWTSCYPAAYWSPPKIHNSALPDWPECLEFVSTRKEPRGGVWRVRWWKFWSGEAGRGEAGVWREIE